MSRLEGFRGEYLWEFEIAQGQIVAAAEAFPAAKYDWRPHAGARSVSEVLVHVATGTLMLLDFIGDPIPVDLYGELPAPGQARFLAILRRNDELGHSMRDKTAVVELLQRALNTARDVFTQSADADLARPMHFFGEQTTARRAWLRLLTHTHEHMGQMIGYLRANAIAPSWPDWRPDRRARDANS
jgi:uncharacterized damage-inducible protein DinB